MKNMSSNPLRITLILVVVIIVSAGAGILVGKLFPAKSNTARPLAQSQTTPSFPPPAPKITTPTPKNTATPKAPTVSKPAPTVSASRKDTITVKDIPRTGSQTWNISTKLTPANSKDRKLRLFIRVEKDLPYDADAIAARIMKTLQDERGWQPINHIAFEQVASQSQANVTISLATPSTVDVLCAPLQTRGQVSCGRIGNVVLNADRWTVGTPEFSDIEQYRDYLINHEIGHDIGHPHELCPGKGKLAPVMMQQTKGLKGCKPNGWPAANA